MSIRRASIAKYSIILLVILAAGWWAKRQFFATASGPSYTTTPVHYADLEDTVLASGTIEAFEQVSVGAQVSGQLKTLKVSLGDTVKKGQLIAEIDSVTQENNLKTAEATLNNTKAQLAAKQATLEESEKSYQRQQALLKADATAKTDHESAEANLKVARADVEALKATLEEAKVSVETARANLGYTRITAPIDGVVVSVVTKAGQTLNANQSAPTIIKLARLDKVLIKAEISEADVIRVKPGQRVYFTILGLPDRKFDTKVKSVEPGPTSLATDSSGSSSSSSSSSTSSSSSAIYYNAVLEVPNTEHLFRIDMTAQVSVVLADAKHTLVIPASALQNRQPDGSYLVSVLQGNQQTVQKRIKTGLNNRVNVQVLEGLQDGDKVVLGDSTGAGQSSSTRRGPPMGM